MSGAFSAEPQFPQPLPGEVCWPWDEISEPLPETLPNGSPWPRISVVTPSFNQGQFIEETIRSVLLQGYPNLEYIIIDGNSTDNTIEIIKKYEPWLAYWESEPDRGQGHAINKGIRKASGEITFWLNSDDILLPKALRIVAETFTANPQASILSGQALLINEQGQNIGSLKSYFDTWDELITNPRNSIRQISTFFRSNLFDDFGMVDENLYIAMDTELLVRITRFNVPLILENYLAAFREHPEAKTASQLIRGYQETDKVRWNYLNSKNLRSNYRKRSALNWLSLYKLKRFSSDDRLKCLKTAVKINPSIIFTKGFWTSLYKYSIANRG